VGAAADMLPIAFRAHRYARLMYDACWPQLAAQLMAAGLRYDQALQMLGLIDNEGRLLPRDDDQHA
jgi:hypothetical protein